MPFRSDKCKRLSDSSSLLLSLDSICRPVESIRLTALQTMMRCLGKSDRLLSANNLASILLALPKNMFSSTLTNSKSGEVSTSYRSFDRKTSVPEILPTCVICGLLACCRKKAIDRKTPISSPISTLNNITPKKVASSENLSGLWISQFCRMTEKSNRPIAERTTIAPKIGRGK